MHSLSAKKNPMLTKLKRILNSRLFIFAILILLQLGLITALVLNLSQKGVVVYYALTIGSLLVTLGLFSSDLNPAYKMTWGLFVILLPVLGGFYFWLWHRIKLPKKMQRTLLDIHKATKMMNPQDPRIRQELKNRAPELMCQVDKLNNAAFAPVHEIFSAAYFPSGKLGLQIFCQLWKKRKNLFFWSFLLWTRG